VSISWNAAGALVPRKLRDMSNTFEVLIAGGGVAAIEAALALRDLGADRVTLSLIAPNEELVYRPMAVREPFGYAVADRYPLERIAGDIGAKLVKDSFAGLDANTRGAYTESGDELRYDALVLCLGARAQARYEHVITVDDRRLDELLHGLIQDIEEGYVRNLGFVAPPRMAWPLPLYELALMSATRAYDMNIELSVTLLTPEEAPLEYSARAPAGGCWSCSANTASR
jgi:sulfide:quinone oxidoreductase